MSEIDLRNLVREWCAATKLDFILALPHYVEYSVDELPDMARTPAMLYSKLVDALEEELTHYNGHNL